MKPRSEATMLPARSAPMMPRDQLMGNLPSNIEFSQSIFRLTKMRMSASP